MKSRTSSFNLTVFKKDLTRFAPAWGAYLIVLLLVLVRLLDAGELYYRIQYVEDFILAMGWVNLIYAAVVAQLLFGDLYNPRLCNALHAMPVTRDGWFGTHTVSALAFSLLPNLAIALLALPVLQLGTVWIAIPLWLLASTLQYLFFFGVAVLCVMLTGNRLGQLALYVIINFAGLLAYWLASSLYEPLLYGIQINGELFYPFCPVGEISQFSDVFIVDYERIDDALGHFHHYEVYGVAPGEGWGYMAICAGVGVLALVGALALYRKRKLECAGDFMAFPKTEPVVQVLVTIFAGGFFHLFGDAFGWNMKYVLLVVGAVVGFFGCRMLLKRTTRVFQKKAFLGCGAIMAAFALSLVLTYLDPVGITRYVPEAEDVESVKISNSYSLHRHDDFPFEAAEAADIEAILSVHEDCINRSATTFAEPTEGVYSPVGLRLEYKLKNGRTVNRFYSVYPLSEAGQVLKGYFTEPECVLGFPAEKAPEMASCIRSIDSNTREQDVYDLEGLDLEGLLEAIVADCDAGNMAQFNAFHYPSNYDQLDDKDYDYVVTYLEIGWDHEKMETALLRKTNAYGIISYTSLRVYRSCENTLRWMIDNGLYNPEETN